MMKRYIALLLLLASAPGWAADIAYIASGTKGEANGTSITPGLPAGIAEDDFLLMMTAHASNLTTINDVAGWTSLQLIAGPPVAARVFHDIVPATPTAPTVTATNSQGFYGKISAFSGVSLATPLDVDFDVSEACTVETLGSTPTMTAPSINTVNDGAMIVRVYWGHVDAQHTGHSEGTVAFNEGTTLGADAHISMSYHLQTTAGVTGEATATNTAASGNQQWLACTLALRPSGAGGGGDPSPPRLCLSADVIVAAGSTRDTRSFWPCTSEVFPDQEVLEDTPMVSRSAPFYIKGCGDGAVSPSWSGDLPDGVTINSSTGLVSGTPTTPGVYESSVTCTNAVNAETNYFTFTVQDDVGEGGTAPATEADSLFVGAGGSNANNCESHANRCLTIARAVAVQAGSGQNLYLQEGGTYPVTTSFGGWSGTSGDHAKVATYHVAGGSTFEGQNTLAKAIIVSNSSAVPPVVLDGLSWFDFTNVRVRWPDQPTNDAVAKFIKVSGTGGDILIEDVCILAHDVGSCNIQAWINDTAARGLITETGSVAPRTGGSNTQNDLVEIQGPQRITIRRSVLVGQTRHAIRVWSRSKDVLIEDSVFGFGFGDAGRSITDAGNAQYRLWVNRNIIGAGQVSDGWQSNGSGFGDGPVDADSQAFTYNEVWGSLNSSTENAFDLKGSFNSLIHGNVIHQVQGDNDGSLTSAADRTSPAVIVGTQHLGKQPHIIRANIFYDNLSGVESVSCFAVYNNSFVANNRDFNGSNQDAAVGGNSVSYTGSFIHFGSSHCDMNLNLNNIYAFHHKNGVMFDGWHGRMDGNHFHEPQADALGRDYTLSQNFTTLTAWKAHLATRTGLVGDDANATEGNPNFVNVGTDPVGRYSQFNFSNQAFTGARQPHAFASAAGSSSTSLTVDDGVSKPMACIFWDGDFALPGDYIVIGTQPVVQITNRGNCATGSSTTLTLAAARTWNNNDQVWWAESDGTKIDKVGGCAVGGVCPVVGPDLD